MEVDTDKSKIMTNSTNRYCEEQPEVSWGDLGATLCKDGTSLAEVDISIASEVTAMARLNRIWWCNTISFANKFKLSISLVISTLFYGCESWHLLTDSEEKNQGNRN